jgi:hypothetical protein
VASSNLAGFLGSATPQIIPFSTRADVGSVTLTPILINTTTADEVASVSNGAASLTLSAEVAASSDQMSSPVAVAQQGSVTFSIYDGSGTQVASLSPAALDASGVASASASISGLATGVYTIAAVYSLPNNGGNASVGYATLYVLPYGVTANNIFSATASGGTATATTPLQGSNTQPDVSATVTGSGTVTVAEYSADPVGSLPNGGAYYDVHVSNGNALTAATIVRCNVGTNTTAYWYNGTSWVAASPQSYDASTGCITVGPLDTSTTSPTIAQLQGTPWSETPTPTMVSLAPETVKYSHTTPLQATISVASPYSAVSGASIAGTVQFTLGSLTLGSATVSSAPGASSVTATLNASAAILQAAGQYTVTATFTPASGSYYENSAGTGPLTVIQDDDTLTYTGPTVIANAQPSQLSAVLKADGTTPVAGRTLTFTLGTSQGCTAVTDATGTGTCTIASVNQPLGAGSVAVSFAGDAYYVPGAASQSTMIFAFVPGGAFVVGDKSVGPVTAQTIGTGATVTFWGAQWASANKLSGGSAPTSFKGFENSIAIPSVGATWTAPSGNSTPPAPPPAPLPSYMGVIVSSSITQSGSTISGKVVHVVVVRTAPGYGPDPSKPGTGTVVAAAS